MAHYTTDNAMQQLSATHGFAVPNRYCLIVMRLVVHQASANNVVFQSGKRQFSLLGFLCSCWKHAQAKTIWLFEMGECTDTRIDQHFFF